ncbi:hypothetical protein L1787_16620 [Acuticoccus sp. M5D2P5]|uniref:hypothetical protein n=1 Tax=Acuticoccus kalidii TaxID=2910977 RepID=UPI001F367738|nr:hypothetical protein [Acuticoccus kalidii]MCF3935029.1 hypothetical protein [Acuticoccus kalidii]
MTDEESEAGPTTHQKLLAAGMRYLTAAEVLFRSTNGREARLVSVPILHLTAHGIEVLLKGNLVGEGLDPYELKKGYGHDIAKLWAHESNRRLRGDAETAARGAWQRAEASRRFIDGFSEDPVTILAEYISDLSALHSKESDFALRYVAEPGARGPRPRLLIDTFLPVADRYLYETMAH